MDGASLVLGGGANQFFIGRRVVGMPLFGEVVPKVGHGGVEKRFLLSSNERGIILGIQVIQGFD